jgi:hypothetical protein
MTKTYYDIEAFSKLLQEVIYFLAVTPYEIQVYKFKLFLISLEERKRFRISSHDWQNTPRQESKIRDQD